MQKVTKIGFIVWFLCAFFYALEFIVRASGNSLFHSYSMAPYSLSPGEIGVLVRHFTGLMWHHNYPRVFL